MTTPDPDITITLTLQEWYALRSAFYNRGSTLETDEIFRRIAEQIRQKNLGSTE
jgi:hypothetical protein